MLKKILVSSLVLVGVFSVAYIVFAADGSNYVDVTSCAQVGKDIQISRGGQKYVLTSSCRNAGHGYRDYKMTCVSSNRYKVEWTEGCVPVKPPVYKDQEAPKVSISSDKAVYRLGEQINIKASATDNVGVVKISLVSGKSELKKVLNSNYLTYSTTADFETSYRSFRAFAIDAAGNQRYSEIVVKVVSNEDVVVPTVVLTTDKKKYIEGETAYITATANDNVKVKTINVYNEIGTLLRSCSYSNTCTATDLITFNAPTGINWGITGFSARVYDEAGNEGYKYLDVEVNRKIITNTNLSITAPISLFNENGVSWIKISGNAYADANVSSVEIYLGTEDTKYSQSLVKKCTYSDNNKNTSCVLTFPRSLYRGGFYWARVIAKDGSTKDSDLTYYNY